MTEPKFTPPPWGGLKVSGDRKTITVRADHDGWHRLECDVESDDCDFDTAMANALLICAAPDLFAFIRDYAANSVCSCDDRITHEEDVPCDHCRAAELVAKAMGQDLNT